MDTQELRKLLAENLKRLIKYAAEHDNSKAANAVALDENFGVSDSATSRYKLQQAAANLDHLARYAQAFGVQPWELLYPSYDPANPPEVLTTAEREHRKEVLLKAAQLLGMQTPDEAQPHALDGEDRGRTIDSRMHSKSAQKHAKRS